MDPAKGHTYHILANPDGGEVGATNMLAIAPDGSWLAVADDKDHRIRVWDLLSGEKRYDLTSGAKVFVSALSIAPSGEWIAAGMFDGSIHIWDAREATIRQTLHHGGADPVTLLVPDPAGDWLATATRDGIIQIWDLRTGRTRHTLTGSTGPIEAFAVAPSGAWLATTGSGEVDVQIWDMRIESSPSVPTPRRVSTAAATPDDTWVATNDYQNREILIWDASTGRLAQSLEYDGSVTALAAGPDGTWLVAAFHDGTVQIQDIATEQCHHPFSRISADSLVADSLVVAPDGSWVAAVGAGYSSVEFWDLATESSVVGDALGHTFFRESDGDAVASPDGAWLATVSGWDSTVRVWDPATAEVLHTLEPRHDSTYIHRQSLLSVCPTSAWLAVADRYTKDVQVYIAETGQLLSTISPVLDGESEGVSAIAAAPDGRLLAIANSFSGSIQLWDVTAGRIDKTLIGSTGWVSSLTFSSDQQWLVATSDDGTVRVWEARRGKPVASIRTGRPLEPVFKLSTFMADSQVPVPPGW